MLFIVLWLLLLQWPGWHRGIVNAATTTMMANCSAAPVSLSIANSTLSPDVERRGIAATLGTPPQKFVMHMSAYVKY